MKNEVNNIVVPYDNDELSEYAASYAVGIARNAKATLSLFYVVEHPTQDTFNSMGIAEYPDLSENVYMMKLIEKAEDRMREFQNNHPDIKINWHIKIGHPYEQLTEVISEENTDLLILGTHDEKGTGPGFVQSHTEKIINHSIAPVIILNKPADFASCKNILFATDFRDVNQAFLARLTEFVKISGASLTILKVNTPTYFRPTDENMAEYADFTKKFKLPIHEFLIYDDYEAEEGIVKAAKQINADLIMIGTHRRLGFLRLMLHNTAEGLIRHTNLPVWTWRVGLKD